MNVVLNEYDLLENLIIESLLLNRKNKNFFKDKTKFDVFYENFLNYSKIKLLKLKDLEKNYKEYFNLETSSILIESKTLDEIRVIQEGLWDSIKGVASSAYETVKKGVGSVMDFVNKDPASFWQSVADVVSIFDPTGLIDLINGSIYFARGEITTAFFSFVGAAMVLPGFISSLTVAGAVAGVPMIAAGKALKNILKFGGKIGGPILKLASKALKAGGVVEKLLSVGAKVPGLGTFLNFIKGKIPVFIKAVDEGGDVSGILAKVFGKGDGIIKAADKAAENLVQKGTQIATKGATTAATKTATAAAEKAGKDITSRGIKNQITKTANKDAAAAVSKYTTAMKPSTFQTVSAVGGLASSALPVPGQAQQTQMASTTQPNSRNVQTAKVNNQVNTNYYDDYEDEEEYDQYEDEQYGTA